MPGVWEKIKTTDGRESKGQKQPTKEEKKDQEKRKELFVAEEPVRKLDDLVVPETVMLRIKNTLNRVVHHHTLYEDWGLKEVDPYGSRTAINLFGVPGTGKSFCAEGIAFHLGKKIIRVNYAEIESKYVGETPKNIVAAFEKAKEEDAVLFFDEADSILGKRLTNVTQSSDHGVNLSRSVMLTALDKFDGVVLFATNLAKNYDSAFVRRILEHIEFLLPDFGCRVRLWGNMIPDSLPIAEDVTPEWVAEQSDGLSGGDLLNLLLSSASRAVQREGEERQITRTDITTQIASIRTAKEKVGEGQAPKTVVKETVVEEEELPEDIKEKRDGLLSATEATTASEQEGDEAVG